jgi:hypothetical protein
MVRAASRWWAGSVSTATLEEKLWNERRYWLNYKE